MRAHYGDHVLDGEGRPIAGAVVYIYNHGSTTPITETIYTTDDTAGSTVASNPLSTSASGRYDIWLADEKRVTLKITKAGFQDQTFDIDVLELTSTSNIVVKSGGTVIGTRPAINFVSGATVADDAVNNEIDVTVAATQDLTPYARKDTAQTFTEDQAIEAGNHLFLGDGASWFQAVPGGGPEWGYNVKRVGANYVRLLADNDASLMYLAPTGDFIYYTNSDAGTTVGSTITFVERFRISKAGVLQLGVDTNLYRAAVNRLKTDHSFDVGVGSSPVGRVEAKATGGGAAQESVTWTSAFAAAPVVTVTPVGTAANSARVDSVSTTGASVTTFSGTTATAAVKHVLARVAT